MARPSNKGGMPKPPAPAPVVEPVVQEADNLDLDTENLPADPVFPEVVEKSPAPKVSNSKAKVADPKLSGPIRVRAKSKGYYNHSRIKPDQEFVIANRSEMGLWMEEIKPAKK